MEPFVEKGLEYEEIGPFGVKRGFLESAAESQGAGGGKTFRELAFERKEKTMHYDDDPAYGSVFY